MTNEELESLVETLSEQQIRMHEHEHRVLETAMETDIGEINDLPRLYRLELKHLLEEHDEEQLANQIQE